MTEGRFRLPRLGITIGDPRGIGPELVEAVLRNPPVEAEFLVFGAEGMPLPPTVELRPVGSWSGERGETEAGRLSARAVERAVDAVLAGELDGLVTAPISKRAWAAAGYRVPGHTELLRDRTGVEEVTMMMTAERTSLGGPLRMALLTTHVPLREVAARLTRDAVLRKVRIATAALRDWWGIPRPRLALAALNPHASEDGLFGDEEIRVLEPVARTLREEGLEVTGVHPADTVFRRCLDGEADLVVVPYHDVGLAVLKTVAWEAGVNVTAGLPFPRTAPDHGTAFDIAGRGLARPAAMAEAIVLCARFCSRRKEAL